MRKGGTWTGMLNELGIAGIVVGVVVGEEAVRNWRQGRGVGWTLWEPERGSGSTLRAWVSRGEVASHV